LPRNTRTIDLAVDDCGDEVGDWSYWAYPKLPKVKFQR